ncbi:MAG: fasciclin domain-containing protein [Flavobacterium circumlabens]|uniref:fasciclin domain-containing protein n=1 Tax=Flavobacterium circumlabens TaxID=2133765 RepID=UPI003265C957
MKIIYKLKQIAVCAFLVALAVSCDNDLPGVGGAEQNYNTAYGLIKANTNLLLFNKAIQLAGLEATLNTNEDFTYFVPADAILEAYLVKNGYVNALGYPDITLVPVADLKQIVLSHVVKGAKKRVGKLAGVTADYLETGELTTLANTANPDLYLLGVNVTDGILKVNGSDKPATGLDYYATNGFVNILDNVISLSPPTPVISVLSQSFASPGDVVTITGSHFVKVKSVKFGETEAVFKSISKTAIEVTVPADFGSYALVKVQTEYGISNIATIGVKFLVYGDNFSGAPAPLSVGGWGGTQDFQNTENVNRGTYSIKRTTDKWSAMYIQHNPVKIADYGYLKVSIYATVSTRILFSIGGTSDDDGKAIDIKAGEWNNISIPISDLHPEKLGTNVNSLFVKEYSGLPGIIYLDDIGYL